MSSASEEDTPPDALSEKPSDDTNESRASSKIIQPEAISLHSSDEPLPPESYAARCAKDDEDTVTSVNSKSKRVSVNSKNKPADHAKKTMGESRSTLAQLERYPPGDSVPATNNAAGRPVIPGTATAIRGPEADEYGHTLLSRHVSSRNLSSQQPQTVSSPSGTRLYDGSTLAPIGQTFLADPPIAIGGISAVAVVVDDDDPAAYPLHKKKSETEPICCGLLTPCGIIECHNLQKRRFAAVLVVVVVVAVLAILGGMGVFNKEPEEPGPVPIKPMQLENYYDDGSVCGLQKLNATDWDARDFGNALAFDGSYIVVGSGSQKTATNQAHVFRKDESGRWVQEAKLVPPTRVTDDVKSTQSVGVSGDTVVIGQLGDSFNGHQSGAAYTFTKNATGRWDFEARLLPSDGSEEDMFGTSVDIDGDLIVVGALHYHKKLKENNKILGPHTEQNEANVDPNDRSHDGKAYIFARKDGVWAQEARLIPGDGGQYEDRFGHAVSISGETVLVGATKDDDWASGGGAVHVYVRTETSGWTLQTVLLPWDGRKGDQFGHSVDLDGDVAIVGAKFHDSHTNPQVDHVGSAYVFQRIGSNWEPQDELMANDAKKSDTSGESVGIHGNFAVVGAWKESTIASNAGAAYIYSRSDDGSWRQIGKLAPTVLKKDNYYGGESAIVGSTVVVGAGGNVDDAAYVFELCPA